MEIQWLGTAGFRIQTREACFLIDPYLSRNPDASPHQPLTPKDLGPASHIFLSHGHFDHIMDIPAIARQTGGRVFCSPTAAHTLSDMGLDPARIETVENEGVEIEFKGVKAKAFHSRHIRFDFNLLATTLVKIGRNLPKILPLFLNFPCGQVLSWQFELENRRIHFFGSGGSTVKELDALSKYPPDILLVPLQGHSDICARAAQYVRILKPALVIPQHQDDFFPPISQTVDISPFVDWVQKSCPGTQVRVMAVNERFLF